MEIDEKKLDKILSNQRESFEKHVDGQMREQRKEFERYVGAVMEEFSDRLSGVAEMVAQNTEDITVIKTDIEFIKHSLKRKVDVDEFAALEHRVALLENRR